MDINRNKKNSPHLSQTIKKEVSLIPPPELVTSRMEGESISLEGNKKTLTDRYLRSLLGKPEIDLPDIKCLKDIVHCKATGNKSATLESNTSGYERVEPLHRHQLSRASSFGSDVYDDVSVSEIASLKRSEDSPSEEDLYHDQYELVEPVFLAKARPAIVVEDQVKQILNFKPTSRLSYFVVSFKADSLSYVYSDSCFLGTKESPGLYESLAGSFLNIARNKLGVDAASVEDLYASLTNLKGDPSVVDRQEMLSLSLEKYTAAHWSASGSGSSVRSSNRSSGMKSALSEQSGEFLPFKAYTRSWL